MPRAPRRFMAIVLAASTVSCSLFVAGCDGDEASRADAKVNRELRKAYSSDDSLAALKEAAGHEDVSGASKARALAMLADEEMLQANAKARQVDGNEAKVATLVWELGQLGRQIAASQKLIEAYRSYDPAVVRQAGETRVAEVKGEKLTLDVRGQQVNVPALAAIAQRTTELQGEIQKQEAELKELTGQRDALMRQSEEAAAQAERAKGREAVDVYTKASNLRKQASLLSSKIDVASSHLARLNEELATQKGQQEILAGLVNQYQSGVDATEKGFKAVAAQEEAQHRLIMDIYGGKAQATTSPVSAPATIESRGAQLAALVGETEQLRSQAEQQMRSAIEHYAQAQSAAEDFQRKLQERVGAAPADAPQKVAWDDLKKLVNPSAYQLQKAVALQALGGLQASQIESLKARVQLADRLGKTLQGAGLKLPDSLSAKEAQAQLKEVAENVSKTYTDATELESTVLDAPLATESQKNAARVAKILSLYSWSNAQTLVGNAAESKKHRAEAVEMVKGAVADGVELPALPPEIAPAAKVATSAPGAAAGAGAAPAGGAGARPASAPPAGGAPAAQP